MEGHMPQIIACRRIVMIGAGSSYHCGIASRPLLEELTERPVSVEESSDFLERGVPVLRDDVCLLLSVTGETPDTLLARRYCHNYGAITVGVTNKVDSSIAKESDCAMFLSAGNEVGKTATKSYTAMCTLLITFALVLSADRATFRKRRLEIIAGLQNLKKQMLQVLTLEDKINHLAGEIQGSTSILITGRGFNFASSLEGASKITMLTGVHAEGVMGGQLTNGFLPLLEGPVPLIMIVTMSADRVKCLSQLQRLTAAGVRPIIICTKDDHEMTNGIDQFLEIPDTVDCLQGILSVIVLQLLAYKLAVHMDRNLDSSSTISLWREDSSHKKPPR